MRARTVALVIVISSLTTACGLFGIGGCERYIRPVEGSPTATSCPETLELRDHIYDPWCREVRPGHLGPVLGQSLPRTSLHVVRAIVGVSVEDAVAVKTTFPNAPVSERSLVDTCGLWRFAPEIDLGRDRAERVARRVTVPRATDRS